MSGMVQRPIGRSSLNKRTMQEIEQLAEAAAHLGVIDPALHPISSHLHLGDLSPAFLRFKEQGEVLDQLGLPQPIAYTDFGEIVIDVYSSSIGPTAPLHSGSLKSVPLSRVSKLVQTADMNVSLAGFKTSTVSTDDAKDNFKKGFTDFLTHRTETSLGAHGAVKGNAPGTPALPGLNIVVNTINNNLQVLFSPAFFLTVQTVFGNGLSSPVQGALGPGLYVFGAQGHKIPLTFEHSTQYQIPPTTTVNMVSV